MKGQTRSIVRAVILAAGVAVLWGALSVAASQVAAAPDDKPKPPPKDVDVQAYVIMASKDELPRTDPALKEIADLLMKRFKGVFNQFRFHNSLKGEVKLEKTTSFPVIENYYLKVTYLGVKDDKDRGRMISLSWRLVKRTQVTEDGKKKTRETSVAGPFNVNVVRGNFFLFGGPEVKKETMILAVRVLN